MFHSQSWNLTFCKHIEPTTDDSPAVILMQIIISSCLIINKTIQSLSVLLINWIYCITLFILTLPVSFNLKEQKHFYCETRPWSSDILLYEQHRSHDIGLKQTWNQPCFLINVKCDVIIYRFIISGFRAAESHFTVLHSEFRLTLNVCNSHFLFRYSCRQIPVQRYKIFTASL